MEYVPHTARHVPEWLGGIYANGHVYAGLRIPDMDSFLVGFGPGTRVTGWDTVPRPAPAGGVAAPPVLRRHGRARFPAAGRRIVGGLGVVAAPPAATPAAVLAAGAVSGLAAVAAMECGWVVTEVGRQPWVVYRLQTTGAAATANGGILASLSLVIVVYAVLGAATIAILRMLSRRWRRGDLAESAVPYGPPAQADRTARR